MQAPTIRAMAEIDAPTIVSAAFPPRSANQRRRPALATTALAVLLSLPGCGLVTSEAPIAPAEEAVTDTALSGYWHGAIDLDGEREVTLTVREVTPGTYWTEYSLQRPNQTADSYDGAGSAGSVTLHTSRAAGTGFLNVHIADDYASFVSGNMRYVLLRYEILEDGALVLWSMSPRVVERLVSRGELGATTRSDDGGVRLTAASAELRQTITTHGTGHIFDRPVGRLERIARMPRLASRQ